jgi:hypothetical protein
MHLHLVRFDSLRRNFCLRMEKFVWKRRPLEIVFILIIVFMFISPYPRAYGVI